MRITFHWTAGTHYPNVIDKEHYHYLIDRHGQIHKGFFSIQDNNICSPGTYAAHTGGGNTKNIGIAYCGMKGFKNRNQIGDYPLTQIQCEAGFKLAASLMKTYNIPLENIETHYTFGLKNPKTSSRGKIDIIYLPPYESIETENILFFMKNKIKWYGHRESNLSGQEPNRSGLYSLLLQFLYKLFKARKNDRE